MNSDRQGEIGFLSHHGGRQGWNQGHLLGCFLVMLYPEIKVNSRLYTSSFHGFIYLRNKDVGQLAGLRQIGCFKSEESVMDGTGNKSQI